MNTSNNDIPPRPVTPDFVREMREEEEGIYNNPPPIMANLNNYNNEVYDVPSDEETQKKDYKNILEKLYNQIGNYEIDEMFDSIYKIELLLQVNSTLINELSSYSNLPLLYMSYYFELYNREVFLIGGENMIEKFINICSDNNADFFVKIMLEDNKTIIELAIIESLYNTVQFFLKTDIVLKSQKLLLNINEYYALAGDIYLESSDSSTHYILSLIYVYYLVLYINVMEDENEDLENKKEFTSEILFVHRNHKPYNGFIQELVTNFNNFNIPPDILEYIMFNLLKNGAEFHKEYRNESTSRKNIYYLLETLEDPDSIFNTMVPQSIAENCLKLIKRAYAMQLILATPITLYLRGWLNNPKGNKTLEEHQKQLEKSCKDFVKLKTDMVNNFIKHYPEAFFQQFSLRRTSWSSHKISQLNSENKIQVINPSDRVMDFISLEDTKIEDFLKEDVENHIVLRDYSNPSATFLINIQDIKRAIEIDCMQVNISSGEKNETNVYMYDPQNSSIVPGPLRKGGRAIVYECKEKLDGSVVSLNMVNNLEPYFDFKSVGGWGGLVPLLQLYELLFIPNVKERGQYFSFKILDRRLDPLASISSVMYPDTGGANRFDGMLNYVSAAHCQEGQYGNEMTIFRATNLKKVSLSGRVRNKRRRMTRKKRRRSRKKLSRRKRLSTRKR